MRFPSDENALPEMLLELSPPPSPEYNNDGEDFGEVFPPIIYLYLLLSILMILME